MFVATAAVFGIIAIILMPTGYFGPLSARVRGLFVRHTRTGNPLVDSVAEHQPASPQAYWQYLHYMCYCAPVGYALCIARVTPVAKVLQAGKQKVGAAVVLLCQGTIAAVDVLCQGTIAAVELLCQGTIGS